MVLTTHILFTCPVEVLAQYNWLQIHYWCLYLIFTFQTTQLLILDFLFDFYFILVNFILGLCCWLESFAEVHFSQQVIKSKLALFILAQSSND